MIVLFYIRNIQQFEIVYIRMVPLSNDRIISTVKIKQNKITQY